MSYEVLMRGGKPVKMWTEGVPVEEEAKKQLVNVSKMPFIYRHVAVLPDVHVGKGATIGSVIPTKGAIIPAAVGVDIGCGMNAVRTSLTASDLPDSLSLLRDNIEIAVPHGKTKGRDKGSWGNVPLTVAVVWDQSLRSIYEEIVKKHPKIGRNTTFEQLGTLGGGNHFIEVCLDENDQVWIMLHSGSRGPGNRVGDYFINLAKEDMRKHFINLPDQDLAYLVEGTEHFDDYVKALHWAQDYAAENRRLMLAAVIEAVRKSPGIPPFSLEDEAINCHHNYVARENHFGENVWITRKGAVRAREGDLGIIPGSMGARSYIVRGLGNVESFNSCSHGAGRVMSRSEAKRRFTVDDHIAAMGTIEARTDVGVIDETPMAYKDVDAVMRAQADLVEPLHELRQLVVIKG